MPDNPAKGSSPPAAPEVADLALVPSERLIHPGELVEVDVFLDSAALRDLRGYQLHLGVSGGRSGTLEVVDISIGQPNVFTSVVERRGTSDERPVWSAFNLQTQQVLAGLDGAGIPAEPGAYLATFIYRASADAAGTFDIELLHGQGVAVKSARSFLFATPAASDILIGEATAARVRVLPRPRRS
jgi:hypothetical protein